MQMSIVVLRSIWSVVSGIIELLGETRIIRIIILIIIIRAGTPLVGHSFSFNWKPKCIDPKMRYILDSS